MLIKEKITNVACINNFIIIIIIVNIVIPQFDMARKF